ncbi:hypothetical protein INP83_12290 [Mucilaginibacter sp. 21P]|uniref:hypothetical protein n=1 Tax=Mucilaginibacter sp. 21P TaxID=2778902 RepID=UPI001C5651E8|nr:hypothetical protein [Mucilaginibacter sp. 21P]QXV63883.1 hypothetical protein INP83_12290 [Mucilaginibacter sp. 21P]
MIGIIGISTYFPQKTISVKQLIASENLDEQQRAYFESVGIDTIQHADEQESYDLAKNAALKVIADYQVKPTDINLVVHVQTRLPQYLMSSSSGRLQFEVGAKNANAMSISDLGCTDMSMAVKIAADHLKANADARYILICYGNRQYAPSRFRFPITINGDGGVALLIGRTARNQILDVNIKTSGSYWDLFKVDYLGKAFSDYREECSSFRKYGFELAIESKLKISELNDATLNRQELSKADISHYMLQNLSARSFEFYETTFDLKFAGVCRENLNKYGHLGPADIMVNYQAGLDNGTFRSGDKVLIMNNSPVASWSNILLQA